MFAVIEPRILLRQWLRDRFECRECIRATSTPFRSISPKVNTLDPFTVPLNRVSNTRWSKVNFQWYLWDLLLRCPFPGLFFCLEKFLLPVFFSTKFGSADFRVARGFVSHGFRHKRCTFFGFCFTARFSTSSIKQCSIKLPCEWV